MELQLLCGMSPLTWARAACDVRARIRESQARRIRGGPQPQRAFFFPALFVNLCCFCYLIHRLGERYRSYYTSVCTCLISVMVCPPQTLFVALYCLSFQWPLPPISSFHSFTAGLREKKRDFFHRLWEVSLFFCETFTSECALWISNVILIKYFGYYIKQIMSWEVKKESDGYVVKAFLIYSYAKVEHCFIKNHNCFKSDKM